VKNQILNIFLMVSFLSSGYSEKTVQMGPVLKNHNLVEITSIDPTILLDIRYASKNNRYKKAFYPVAKAFLIKESALALCRVQKRLNHLGYGLVVWDAYRPLSVSIQIWDKTPFEERGFVAPPWLGSAHNKGIAVDVTLYDLKTKRILAMPTDFDDFSPQAHIFYSKGDQKSRILRDSLIDCMKKEGFVPYEKEWWHFEYLPFKHLGLLDIPFSRL
jgi:zinc D-Ala-D-Ala dipeptidase